MFELRLLNKLLIVFVLIVLLGCSTQVSPVPLPSLTLTQTVKPVPTSTKVPTTTITPVPMETRTATPSLTSTVPKPEPFVNNCIKLSDGLPPPVYRPNDILLLREDEAPYRPYLLNLAGGVKTSLTGPSGEDILRIFVSPDRQWLAYDTHSYIVLANTKGKTLKQISREKDWTFFWGWLDDNQLMVTRKADREATTPATLVVINLSTGKYQELTQMEYPDFDWINFLPWQHNRVIYDPTLTLAIYPSHSGEPGSVTLLDIPNNKVLAALPADVVFTPQPEWAPNREAFVVAGTTTQTRLEDGNTWYNQELFLIDRNGKITQLTHFTDIYPYVSIGNAKWSPDGRQIAFWFSIQFGANEQLAVLDLDTLQVTNYCTTGRESHMGGSSQLFWSPDSQIVVFNHYEGDDTPAKVMWIDVKNEWGKYGSVMGTGFTVSGWLVSP